MFASPVALASGAVAVSVRKDAWISASAVCVELGTVAVTVTIALDVLASPDAVAFIALTEQVPIVT
jgi:hypothetical protein